MEAATMAKLILACLTVAGQVIILALFFSFVFYKNKFSEFFRKRALLLAFIVALAATLGSLFFSEIAGYAPCELCWFQRIFMYPQVIILGTALIRKEKIIAPYGIVLSLMGAFIAAYNYILQISSVPSTVCSITASANSCSQKVIFEFGYITIATMSLTAFLLIAALLIKQMVASKNKP